MNVRTGKNSDEQALASELMLAGPTGVRVEDVSADQKPVVSWLASRAQRYLLTIFL